MKAIVTVVGKDRVGIIASVCTKLAQYNVNVMDISQTVMQGYFTMMMATDVSECNVSVGDLAKQMDAARVVTRLKVSRSPQPFFLKNAVTFSMLLISFSGSLKTSVLTACSIYLLFPLPVLQTTKYVSFI